MNNKNIGDVKIHDIDPSNEVIYVHDHSEHNVLGELHINKTRVEAITYSGIVDDKEKFDLRDWTKLIDEGIQVEWGMNCIKEFDEVINIPFNINHQPILGNMVLVQILKNNNTTYATLGGGEFIAIEDFYQFYL